PRFAFEGDQIDFSDRHPQPGETVIISAPILNSGGSAEDVTVLFYEGSKIIGTDTIDIEHGETVVAELDWKVPDKPGESILIKAEVDQTHAVGEEEATRIIDIADKKEGFEDDASFILLVTIIAIIVCLISVFVGYQIGRITSAEKPEVVEEEPWTFEDEIESWESTVVAGLEVVETLPPPPPPFPPPPPEECIEKEPINMELIEEEEVMDSDLGEKPTEEDITDHDSEEIE
ncbi:MAG: hypothetical protein JSV09_14720, partial [Thermoplasmata archaeon]